MNEIAVKAKNATTIIASVLLLFGLSIGTSACSTSGSSEYVSIALDETVFPDEMLRTYLSQYFDSNHNGALDEGEAEEIRELGCYTLYDEGTSGYERAKDFPALTSLQGLEKLPELSALRFSIENMTSVELPFMERLLTIQLDGNADEGGRCLQGLDVSKCTMLQAIHIDNTGVLEIDLSGNRALTDIWVDEMRALSSYEDDGLYKQRIVLPDNPTRIQRLTLMYSGLYAIETIDLSGCDELESLIVYGCTSNIFLPRTDTLTCLLIGSHMLPAIDLTGTPSIQDLSLSGNMLTEVDLSNQKNLQYVSLLGTDVSSVDLSASAYVTQAVAVPSGCNVISAGAEVYEGVEFDLEDEKALRLYPRVWHRADIDED